MARVKRKEVVLGGCCLSSCSPRWKCWACGHMWGRVDGTDGPSYDIHQLTRELFERVRNDPEAERATRGMNLIDAILTLNPEVREAFEERERENKRP
ncbi:MAG: hypothetical protein KF699_02920 [Phycisphaeraceae bacterium]|nr:hypothetical protein [Phycisphaeraceae bacterium]